MIGKIKGTIAEIDSNEALIDTAGGVFYKVYILPSIIHSVTAGDNIELYTYLNVKEDSLTLFGFDTKEKYRVFSMLLSVDGVGPKLAFTIISRATISELISAITSSNYHFLSSIPGIGKKTAQKILVELSGKFNSEFTFEHTIVSKDDQTVVDALVSLGFEKSKSQQVLAKLDKNSSVEDKIKYAIQLMTQK